jgi:hypothetical protein
MSHRGIHDWIELMVNGVRSVALLMAIGVPTFRDVSLGSRAERRRQQRAGQRAARTQRGHQAQSRGSRCSASADGATLRRMTERWEQGWIIPGIPPATDHSVRDPCPDGLRE